MRAAAPARRAAAIAGARPTALRARLTRAPRPGRVGQSVTPSAPPRAEPPATATPAPTTTVTLGVAKRVAFGDAVVVVGSPPSLGGWDPAVAPVAAWGEGDVWTLDVDAGDGCAVFKFAVRRGDGSVEWESGPDRSLASAAGVVSKWGKAGAGEAAAPPAAAALAPAPLSAPATVGLAPGGAEWQGAAPAFMRSNEWGGASRVGVWNATGLTGPAAGIVKGDAGAPDWLAKLAVAQAALIGADGEKKGRVPADPAALPFVATYLALVNTGALPCVEGGGHTRPSRHANTSRVIFRAVEWLLGDPATDPAVAAVARRLHARLPSFDAAYVAATPLTRVRDLAHRNDIPQALKAEIKHTLQNKLHRNAGPEDLVATHAMLARLRAGDPATPASFLSEFELFAAELRTFFGAADLDAQLAGLAPALDADGAAAIDRALATKDALVALDGGGGSGAAGVDALRELSNALADAAHAATTVRAVLAAGLASGLRNDASDASLAMRQRWRQADARLEDWVFALLSRLDAAVDPPFLATAPDASWSVPLGAVLLAVRNVGLSGWRPGECLAVENELCAWRAAAGLDERDGALRLKATLERALRLAQGVADGVAGALAPAAAALGPSLGVERAASSFPEAEVRASVAFQLAKLSASLLTAARSVAGVPPWDCVVAGAGVGVVVRVGALADAAPALAARPPGAPPAIIVARTATGDEEVGAAAGVGGSGVAAVLLAQAVPHLSHLGVRARQIGLPFACCPDGELVDAAVDGIDGGWVEVEVKPDGVSVRGGAAPTAAAAAASPAAAPAAATRAPAPSFDARHASPIPLPDATPARCGAKGTSCGALLRAAAASGGAFAAPPGFVLPFGALAAAAAAVPSVSKALAAVDAAEGDALDSAAAALRDAIAALRPDPAALAAALKAHLPNATTVAVRSSSSDEDLKGASAAGLYDSILGVPTSDPAAVAAAVAAVWASLHTRRAILVRRAAGAASAGGAGMAVIVQAAAPAARSFVLHTSHPARGPAWVAAEVALGVGESLAGAAEGTAWRLAAAKTGGAVETDAFANLSLALDPPAPPRTVDYSTQRLSADAGAREEAGRALARVAACCEAFFGDAQDVEGCFSGDGGVTVVQSRPQPGV
jgi:phosphoglucan,water dikinase